MIEFETAERGDARRLHRVVVDEVQSLGPQVRRIVFEGDSLGEMESGLPAQWLKVAIPDASGQALIHRPYAIRGFYRGWRVVVIDFVLHAGSGPVSAWARSANVGDVVHLGHPRGGYQLDPQARWQLLAGDETALPAIASILEALPEDGVPTWGMIEIPSVEDIQTLGYPEGTDIHWLVRDRDQAAVGELLRDAVSSLHLPEGPGQVFLAGEAGLVADLQQALALRSPAALIEARGYWRHGEAGEHAEP